jgi:hypothetical protein
MQVLHNTWRTVYYWAFLSVALAAQFPRIYILAIPRFSARSTAMSDDFGRTPSVHHHNPIGGHPADERPVLDYPGIFQPGNWRSPEIDLIMQALWRLKDHGQKAALIKLLSENEAAIFSVAHRYGYNGCHKNDEDYVTDFGNAYAVWRHYYDYDRAEAAAQQYADGPREAAQPDPWLEPLAVAANDPIAAVFIIGFLLTAEQLANLLGYTVDPKTLAASATLFSSTVTAAGTLPTGPLKVEDTSSKPHIPNSPLGPVKATLSFKPLFTAWGEVKSRNSLDKKRRDFFNNIPGNLPNHTIVSFLTYDENGYIYLEQYRAGGFQEKVFDGAIGRIPPDRRPKEPYSHSKHGTEMEGIARDLLSRRSGQKLNSGKDGNANGYDIEPLEDYLNRKQETPAKKKAATPKKNVAAPKKPPTQKKPSRKKGAILDLPPDAQGARLAVQYAATHRAEYDAAQAKLQAAPSVGAESSPPVQANSSAMQQSQTRQQQQVGDTVRRQIALNQTNRIAQQQLQQAIQQAAIARSMNATLSRPAPSLLSSIVHALPFVPPASQIPINPAPTFTPPPSALPPPAPPPEVYATPIPNSPILTNPITQAVFNYDQEHYVAPPPPPPPPAPPPEVYAAPIPNSPILTNPITQAVFNYDQEHYVAPPPPPPPPPEPTEWH